MLCRHCHFSKLCLQHFCPPRPQGLTRIPKMGCPATGTDHESRALRRKCYKKCLPLRLCAVYGKLRSGVETVPIETLTQQPLAPESSPCDSTRTFSLLTIKL